MIKYLIHKQIDKKLWDECISKDTSGNIYGYSWYLDIICPGWNALINDDYSTVMPITHSKKYLMEYIFPPYFAQQLGIYSVNEISREVCILFLSAIPSNFKFVEMNLSFTNQWIPETYSIQELPDYVLSFDRSYEALRKQYSTNHERNIRKAAGIELKVFKHGSVNDVVKMFRENRGQQISNLTDKHYEVFKALSQEAMNRKMARVWMVDDKFGVPCAGAVFFESHKKAYFMFSAITKIGRDLSAMHYLINEFISASSEYLEALDFEGSRNADLARFYKGFGSREFLYLQIKRNRLPIPWKWFKK